MTIDGQSESQNGYPVDIKNLEANQEQDGATILICRTYLESQDRKLWKACREGFRLRERETP